MRIVWLVCQTIGLLVGSRSVLGFSYAPNFITKIIAEDTGLSPEGLIETDERTAIPSEPHDPPEIASTVRTRFPPEPNGYLHLGHAKAISFNFAVARMFRGACNLRMDDTNPSKEDREYVDSIVKDVTWIQDGLFEGESAWDGDVRKTSSYFDFIYECTTALIKSGDAYVDSLTAEEMREYRGTLTKEGRNSPYRERSVEENLQLFDGMRSGKFGEGEHVVRAKINMQSPNINLRDPTIYRIKHEAHPETGDKWPIYPMYDFSHPIADSLENVTHSLCTLEFEDHRPFYDWTVDKLSSLGLLTTKPRQIEFSRLNIQSTVLSKRKLIQLVQDNHVSGWDDPRLPTLSGMRRRGYPPAALRLFCQRIGISKSDSNIDMTVLEDCVRETMDATCPRAFAVIRPLKLTVSNWEGSLEEFEADQHPKVDSMGKRVIPFGKSIYIERSDFFDVEGPEGKATGGQVPPGFKRLVPGGRVRLRYAYVVELEEIIRDPESGEPVELRCKYLPETRSGTTPEGMTRVKGIIHWVEASTASKVSVYQYDRLFRTKEPGRESGDFLLDVNPDSLEIIDGCVAEPSVGQAVSVTNHFEGSDQRASAFPYLAYQFERNGYFALDQAFSNSSNIVFNRVVSLRDTWNEKAYPRVDKRSRGGGAKPKEAVDTPAEDILRVAFRACTIMSAKQHPEAQSLLVCELDCGDISDDGEVLPPRTVVAALGGKISPERMEGRKVVAVTNLKPAKLRGIESTAMLLAASVLDNDEEVVELLDVPESISNGYLISFDGKPSSQPDQMLKSKGAMKAWDRAKSGLRVDDEGQAIFFDGEAGYKMTTTEGPIRTETLKKTEIG